MMFVNAIRNNLEELNKTKKDYIKLIYPDVEDPSEKLMKEAQRRLNTEDRVMRIGLKSNTIINPIEANLRFNHGKK